MQRIGCVGLALTALFLIRSGSAQTYSAEMRGLVSQAQKINFHKYQLLPAPTTNFAIGTMYPLEILHKDFDLSKAGIYGDASDWWSTISENDKQAALRAIVRPAELGTIALDGRHTRPLELREVFPQISALLTAHSSDRSQIHVVISASSLQSRMIDWLELDDAVYMEHLIRPSIIEHADRRDFAITTGDLVLNGFEARLTLSNQSPEAKEKLETALGFFVHSSRSLFDLKSNKDGSYTLAAKLPVVVAVYLALPPVMRWADLGDRQLKPLSTPYLVTQIAKVERSGISVSSK